MPDLTIGRLIAAAAICEVAGHTDIADALTEETTRRTTQIHQQEGEHDEQDQSQR